MNRVKSIQALAVIGVLALLMIPTYVAVREDLAYVALQKRAVAFVDQNERDETAYMQKPISLVGVADCDGKLAGILVVTGDGQIHEQDIDPKDKGAIASITSVAQTLADGASVVIRPKCGLPT